MKDKKKCTNCGKEQSLSQMGEYWRNATMFQVDPTLSCHDEKNCKSKTK